MIVTVTGLRTNNIIATAKFWWLAIPAFRQAQKAKGNLFCETRKINGVYHTLTAWKDRKHMKHYVLSGAHRKAMGQFHKIATGTTISFEADLMPSWQEAVAKWEKDSHGY